MTTYGGPIGRPPRYSRFVLQGPPTPKCQEQPPAEEEENEMEIAYAAELMTMEDLEYLDGLPMGPP